MFWKDFSSKLSDKKLQEAISRSSTWSSCFLHVVSCKNSLPKKLIPHPTGYMPFGTFLFCSATGVACFENPESVLELLVSSINDQSQGFEVTDYGKLVENLYRKAICKDFIPRGLNLTHSTSLNASIRLQLCAALGLTSDMQGNSEKRKQYLEVQRGFWNELLMLWKGRHWLPMVIFGNMLRQRKKLAVLNMSTALLGVTGGLDVWINIRRCTYRSENPHKDGDLKRVRQNLYPLWVAHLRIS